MNKITYVFVIVLIASIFSCNKSDDSGDFPKSFVKRVVVEEFSGEWCAACVSGAERFQAVLDENPNRVFGVSIHSGDPFELEYPTITNFLLNQFSITYFPYAIIDRTTDESKEWSIETRNRLYENFSAGLKIETIIEDNKLDIKIDYATIVSYKNIHLTVYLTENNVPESSPGAQAFGGGNYVHQHVLREVVSGKIGDPIELSQGIIYTKEYTGINIAKYKKEDLNVVAFLHFDSSLSYEVLNANKVKLGENSGW